MPPNSPDNLPAPPVDGLAGQYFAWHRHHELRITRCADCSTWIHPPQHFCGACGGNDLHWQPTAARGTVFTWTVTHRSFHPAFAGEVPYICAVVTLDEGPRVLTMLRGIAPDAVVPGMRVVAEFEPRDGDASAVVFVPAPTQDGTPS